MDSSAPEPPTPPPPVQPANIDVPSSTSANKKVIKPKIPKKKKPKEKKEEDHDIVLLADKHDINPSSSSSIAKRSVLKEKQSNTYVLMKHRRCYSAKSLPCLHSLTLEYKICREHTIRHMSHTQELFKRRGLKPKSNIIRLIDEAANCLKSIVNNVVEMEENRLERIN